RPFGAPLARPKDTTKETSLTKKGIRATDLIRQIRLFRALSLLRIPQSPILLSVLYAAQQMISGSLATAWFTRSVPLHRLLAGGASNLPLGIAADGTHRFAGDVLRLSPSSPKSGLVFQGKSTMTIPISR